MGELLILSAESAPALAETAQARSDEHLVELWLFGRPETTRGVYSRDIAQLLRHVGTCLRDLTIGDVQSFAGSLAELRPASQARKLAAVKSLTTFAMRLGYLQVDVARAIRLPKIKDVLAERIVVEAEVLRLIQLEPNARNHALLSLLYRCGLRISEACALCWRDLKPAKSGGQATIFGKGGKTRTVLIGPKLWRALSALRGQAGDDQAVFQSKRDGGLDRSQAHRIVKAAAKRAGVNEAMSAHWLRHAHASHSLDHGAPVHVLQASLGHASLTTTSRYVHVRPGDGSAKYLPE